MIDGMPVSLLSGALGAQGFEGWVSLMVLDYKLVILGANKLFSFLRLAKPCHLSAHPQKMILHMSEMDDFGGLESSTQSG